VGNQTRNDIASERLGARPLEIFSTSPQSKDSTPERYLGEVVDLARASEGAGHEGILVYTENGIVDPWLVSQAIITATERICPLVAVQPIYMHPYSVAKMITSYGFIFGRRVYLNMLAGGFRNDLLALGDETPHDDRYKRTIEYTLIIKQLLAGDGPVSFAGDYYNVENLILRPSLPAELQPGILISGSSPAGLAAAEAIGATPVRYPHPPGEEDVPVSADEAGVRVGIIARDSEGAAWDEAHERFPEDRKGKITHAMAMRVSDSHWHGQLSQRRDEPEQSSPYWLGPFQNGQTFCPYLVGSYETVGAELARYVGLGDTTFILDILPSRNEIEHVQLAFAAAGNGRPA
jgi:alkanesulfonate monooxygenase